MSDETRRHEMDALFDRETSASLRNIEEINLRTRYTLTTQVTFHFSADKLDEVISAYEDSAYAELIKLCEGGVLFGARGATLKQQPVNLITHREADRRAWRSRNID